GLMDHRGQPQPGGPEARVPLVVVAQARGPQHVLLEHHDRVAELARQQRPHGRLAARARSGQREQGQPAERSLVTAVHAVQQLAPNLRLLGALTALRADQRIEHVSVEQFLEEAAALPAPVAVAAVRAGRVRVAAAVRTGTVRVAAAVRAWAVRAVLIRLPRWHRGRWRGARAVRRVRRRARRVVGRLGRGDLFELAPVEKDALAALALIDVHAVLVDGPHQVLALGTDHEAHPTGGRPHPVRPDWYANTTNWARSRAPSLVIARPTWVRAVAGLMNSRSAISSLLSPSPTRPRISFSRSVNVSSKGCGLRGRACCSTNVLINVRVTLGDSSAPPSATVRMACSRSAGGVSFSRNPLAPCRRASKTYSSISNVVSTMMRVSVSCGSAVIRRVASRPSMPGMRMSINTTSGRSSRAMVTAATPSAAWPANSNPSSLSINARRPTRTSSWSSATSTDVM